MVNGYIKARVAIEKHRSCHPIAANNLQFYLNGKGGVKKEDYNTISKDQGFKNADNRLDGHFMMVANNELASLKNGESKTISATGYAAQFTAYTNDLYYASGTSFIKGNAQIQVAKDNNGNATFNIDIQKTWIDTYDWHKGLGIDYLAADISDSEMWELQSWGAKNFELRSYYQTKIQGHLGSAWFGILQNTNEIDHRENYSENVQTESHPDK